MTIFIDFRLLTCNFLLSLFSTDAIVLRKTLIRDNKGFCDLFTRDFGKVDVWITESKIKTPIDMGGIIQAQVKVEGGKNSLQGYKIKRSIQYQDLSYIQIKNILSITALIFRTIPFGMPNSLVFDDFIICLPFLENPETNHLAKCLFELKLTKYLGISLPMEKYSTTLQKLHTAIDRIKLSELLKETKILAHLDEMQAYTEKCLGKYLD